jgi:hypothetical protein
MTTEPSGKDIRTARAFRAQAGYFRRIGDRDIADALTEAADALAADEPEFAEPLDEEAFAE